jgi:hypothetical protein
MVGLHALHWSGLSRANCSLLSRLVGALAVGIPGVWWGLSPSKSDGHGEHTHFEHVDELKKEQTPDEGSEDTDDAAEAEDKPAEGDESDSKEDDESGEGKDRIAKEEEKKTTPSKASTNPQTKLDNKPTNSGRT